MIFKEAPHFIKLLLSYQHLSRNSTCLAISIFLSLSIPIANTTAADYQLKAYRTSQHINIDGELNEPDWQNADAIKQFIQIEPNTGEKSSEPMEVRILYDNENIYCGFLCHDSQISKLIANEMRRDARNIHENDNVFILIDTYNDKRSGFFFRINALGAIQDRAITNNGDTLNDDWNAVVTCKSKIHQNSWTTELRIPFSQLRFKKSDPMHWGLNVGRELIRNQEESIWAPVPASYGGLAKYRTTNLGTLTGLNGITPTQHWEILPYILPGITQNTDENAISETTRQLKIGLDAKYAITPNLISDITYHTDFAQVEADQEQVNLTRFNLFFPEKRPFFLEGAGLFDFGIPRQSFRRPPPMLLFYSRRIGLAEGNPIPIILGAKASGKINTYGIGFLNVLTDKFYQNPENSEPIDIPYNNYSVFRITKDGPAGSKFGMIAVNQDEAHHYNRAGGVDIEFRPNENIDVRGMWARTFKPNMSGQNNAWYLGTKWRNNLFRLSTAYTDIDPDFDPAVGFVRDTDIRKIQADCRWAPRPNKYGIREMWSGPEIHYTLNQNYKRNRWNTAYTHWTSFTTNDSIMLNVKSTFEKLDEDFEIREGVIIPIGEYQFNTIGGRFATSDSRNISTTTGFELGNFYNGQIRKFYIKGNIKPNGQINIQVDYQFNRVILPNHAFDANLFSGKCNYSFSTTLFAKIFAQWNTETHTISTNLLINYIYQPGSNFYLVLNQSYDTDPMTNAVLRSTTIVAKITFWWNPY